MPVAPPASARSGGSVLEVFWIFLRLGLTSFGGPVAHLGFFRTEFVQRRRWFTDTAYADLVALCQFLPGPASSQVGMAIGLQRAGAAGLVAAWLAFTLPSAVVLVAFAFGVQALDAFGQGWLAGLKAAAAAVVAHAVLGMARTLTPDLRRALIAVAALVLVLAVPHPLVQVGVIVAAGLLGLIVLPRDFGAEAAEASERATEVDENATESGRDNAGRGATDGHRSVGGRRTLPAVSLGLFALLLAALPLLARWSGHGVVEMADVYYRTGALVFGGGHVVLPLLQTQVVTTGMVDAEAFLAGYGAAQAVPGPLFTFAGYLGAASSVPPSGILGAAIALVAIFLPSALLVLALLPHWDRLRRRVRVRRGLAGVNAGVVGLLAAALVNPVITQGVTTLWGLVIALAAFAALAWWKAPSWAVVLLAALAGFALL
ncbi:chromate efflux transporter [Pseudactinotalea sp. Z1739]|uniref:chromate efflux transporter n=1 Tax=Pseudactinotalea sp. Z1739 TaxID=3413028 RepID=UPI003C7E75BE